MGSSHVFSEIFIHTTWHCQNNLPLITPDIEPDLFALVAEHCRKTKGVHLLAVNGTATHIHLAFQMEPFILLSDFIGKLKGAVAFEINQRARRKAIVWQRGYGAVSFSRRQCKTIVEYIRNQKEHHGSGRELIAALEATGIYDTESDGAGEEHAKAVIKPR